MPPPRWHNVVNRDTPNNADGDDVLRLSDGHKDEDRRQATERGQ